MTHLQTGVLWHICTWNQELTTIFWDNPISVMVCFPITHEFNPISEIGDRCRLQVPSCPHRSRKKDSQLFSKQYSWEPTPTTQWKTFGTPNQMRLLMETLPELHCSHPHRPLLPPPENVLRTIRKLAARLRAPWTKSKVLAQHIAGTPWNTLKRPLWTTLHEFPKHIGKTPWNTPHRTPITRCKTSSVPHKPRTNCHNRI